MQNGQQAANALREERKKIDHNIFYVAMSVAGGQGWSSGGYFKLF